MRVKLQEQSRRIPPSRALRSLPRILGADAAPEARNRLRRVAVVGLDAIGLRLALQFARGGVHVVGIDLDATKVHLLNEGGSDVLEITPASLRKCRHLFSATTDFSGVRGTDAIVICTPLHGDDPSCSIPLADVIRGVASHLASTQLVVVESVEEGSAVAADLSALIHREAKLPDGQKLSLLFSASGSPVADPASRVAAISLLLDLGNAPLREADQPTRDPEQEPAPSIPSKARRRMNTALAERLVHTALVCDFLVVVYTLLCAFWLRFNTGIRELGIPSDVSLRDYAGYIALGAVLLMATLSYCEVYDTRSLLRIRQINARMMKAGFWSFAVFLFAALFFEFRPPISRFFVLIAAGTTTAGLMAWRTMFHSYLRKSSVSHNLQQRVLFVGWNEEARRLARTFSVDIYSAFSVTGCVRTPESVPQVSNHRLARVLGTFDEIEDILRRESVDTVIVADMKLPADDLVNLSLLCEKELIAFKIIPSYFKILVSGLHLETMSGTPVLGVSRLPLDRFLNVLVKGLVDRLGAVIGILFSAPIVLLFGFLVYLESPGPIIYRQRRLGRNGTPFSMFKIRSMQLSAPSSDHLQQSTRPDDPRLLRVGAFMRRWNIDELPQFWNVLRGDMSLVGPRPERVYHSERLKHVISHYNARYIAKPGMTGWAQVNGFRGDTDLTERINYDLFYLENWCLLLDLQILALTLLRNKNAC